MANDLTQNPLVVDTTATNIRPSPARIYGFKHVATGASLVTVTDTASSHIIYESNLAAAGSGNLDVARIAVKGGINVTITGGVLLIYLDDGER
jgi:hypothetical protein